MVWVCLFCDERKERAMVANLSDQISLCYVADALPRSNMFVWLPSCLFVLQAEHLQNCVKVLLGT